MIQSKQDLKRYMEMDKTALHISRKHPRLFRDEIWRYEIILRKHEYYRNTKPTLFAKILRTYYGYKHHKMSIILGIQIPPNVCGGGGLRIMHYGLIVVNPETRIGEWCCIHQGVNIGQNIEPGSVPTIGRNVIFLPGAHLFGKIVIGDNVMVGANAVVTKSFPEGNCRIAGVPARIISDLPNIYQDGKVVQVERK